MKQLLAWFCILFHVFICSLHIFILTYDFWPSPLEQCLAGVRVGRRTELRHNDAVRLEVSLVGFALKKSVDGGGKGTLIIFQMGSKNLKSLPY